MDDSSRAFGNDNYQDLIMNESTMDLVTCYGWINHDDQGSWLVCPYVGDPREAGQHPAQQPFSNTAL